MTLIVFYLRVIKTRGKAKVTNKINFGKKVTNKIIIQKYYHVINFRRKIVN